MSQRRAKRIQYQRGMKLPPNTVYVGRPSRWGNPFGSFKAYNRDDEIGDYKRWMKRDLSFRSAENAYGVPPTRAEIRRVLGGKDLACWCSLEDACHADYLLTIANGGRVR